LLKENKIKLPSFFKDRRTDEDYIYDLIDGWLMEDIICDAWLRERLMAIDKTITVVHMGTNRDRTLQKYNPRNITTEPDFLYKTTKGKEIKIELQMARKPRKEGYDMKDTKVKRALENGHIFLWVIVPNDKFFVVEPNKDLQGVVPMTNPLWGGKLVYRLALPKCKQLGMYDMSSEIPKVLYSTFCL